MMLTFPSVATPSGSSPQSTQRTELVASRTESFFRDLASNASSHALLNHFSHRADVYVQHAPQTSKYPTFWRVNSRNGVRSYFDIVSGHFSRKDVNVQSAVYVPGVLVPDYPTPGQQAKEEVVLHASTDWTWRGTDDTFTEDHTCTLQFDDNGKVISFVVSTQGRPETCVMLAMDKKVEDYRKK